MNSMYDSNLEKNSANYVPLTPLSFLKRAAIVYPDRLAIIHGQQTFSYQEFYSRSCQLASALTKHGLQKDDTVSVVLSNTPPMLFAHYGVPMSGAVLHSINTRLDPKTIAFQLKHAESKIVIVDKEFASTMKEALTIADISPLIIDYNDPEFEIDGSNIGTIEFAEFIEQGDPNFEWQWPDNEWDAITLNYTSGTTGDPKGVVYHHRGAYLLAQGNIVTASIAKFPVYLWTLPMFHCNGWCFPWSISVVGGTHVCLRWVRQKLIWDAIANHQVTHLCGAPIVMSTILQTPDEDKHKLDHTIEFFTAAAPPPESILAEMKTAGFNVTHLYGLTECYGPAVVNDWKPEWDKLSSEEQAAKKARQGVCYTALEHMTVLDPKTMSPVPADGEAIGEVMLRGNVIMKGYLKNSNATEESFAGGWFHTGDLGVMHPDHYIQLKDRSKDIIISGGENISSIEIEDVLYKHPAVAAVAVVARPNEKWGESPMAFIELKTGFENLSEGEIIDYCKDHLASFKCPRNVKFTELPKTSTGKIQKFMLREWAKST